MTVTTHGRGLALTVLCAASLMIILDGTIVTVALPSIQRDLHFTTASLTWVVNAYLIAFAGLLLLAGRLGDLIGHKRMFLAGLAVFAAASLLCGLAARPAMLVAARFVQGAGAAMAASVSLGMVATLYPEPPRRARAVGAFSFTGAAGASTGLVLGGVLTQALSWHWIFFVNLPIAVAAGLPAVCLLPRGRGIGLRAGADVLGSLLVTAGLMLTVAALVETSHYGWASARTLVSGAVAAALLAAFVLRQAKAGVPLLPLRVLASRDVAGANLSQFLVIASAYGFQVVITLYMQEVLGYGPAAAGLGLLPTALMIGAVSLGLAARLIGRFGGRTVLLTGMGLIVLALLLLTRLPVHGGYPGRLLPALLLLGLGGGLTLPTVAMLGMAGATPGDAGVISGLFNTAQQVGAAFGVALLTTVAAGRAAQLRVAGLPGPAALAGGDRLAFALGAGLAIAALAVGAALLRPGAAGQPGAGVGAGTEAAQPARPAADGERTPAA